MVLIEYGSGVFVNAERIETLDVNDGVWFGLPYSATKLILQYKAILNQVLLENYKLLFPILNMLKNLIGQSKTQNCKLRNNRGYQNE